MRIPIPIAERYIGQEEVIAGIEKALKAVAEGPDHCGVLNLVARGGGGKTFLLRQLPQILGPEQAYMARIIDLSDTQNRSGVFLEEALIAGLGANTGQGHRLAADDLNATFAVYRAERDKLDRARASLSSDEFRQHRTNVRQAFAEALNQIARQRSIILRFDTTESLISEPPEPALRELLVRARENTELELQLPSALDLFFSWFREVIPQLRNVLVLLCGRPVEPPTQVGQTLYGRSCADLNGVQHQQIELRPLHKEEIEAYLQAALPERQPTYLTTLSAEAMQLSNGAPLLVTSYVWLANVEQQPNFDVTTRAGFERHLVTRVLNPIEVQIAQFELKVLSFCFYMLAYARRGLQREQLTALLAQFDLPKAHAAFTPDEQDRFTALLEQINQVALIKERPTTGVLFLHDEVYRMLDEAQTTEGLGFRTEILTALRDMAQTEHEVGLEQVVRTPAERAAFLAVISKRIYYDLELDPRQGYEEYLLAQLRLFENREYELPLLLRDELWRWVNLRAYDPALGAYQPNRERLADPELKLSLDELIADDLVWLVRFYLARNQNEVAVHVARQGQQDWLDRYAQDLYFRYDLLQTTAHALILHYNQDVQAQGAEQNFQQALTITQLVRDSPAAQQPFFRTYVHYFLGRTYTLFGFMYRTLFDLDQAREQYAAAAEAYQQCLAEQPERARLYLNLNEAMVQLQLNQVFVLTRSGAFAEAERLLIPLRRAIRGGNVKLSSARQALIFNLSSILESERRRPEEAMQFAQRAVQLAQQSRNQRIIAQVQAQLGNVGHDSLKRPPYRVDYGYEPFFQAALSFFADAEEQTGLAETALDYARYLRTLAFNEQRQPFPQRKTIERLFVQATELLDQAQQTVTYEYSQQQISVPLVEITLERAVLLRFQDLAEEAAQQLAQAEQQIKNARLPRRALLLAASVTFQRAWLAGNAGDVALLLRNLVAALAHCRLYADTDRTWLRFRELISQNMAPYEDQLISTAQQLLDQADQQLAPDPKDVIMGSWSASIPDLPQRWSKIWSEELSFVQNEIEILFTKRGLA